jgi:DNA-binding CsgD family transcriptional regulator
MGQGVMTEFQLDLSDYEGVLNVVRTAGEARDPDGFSRVVVRELAKLVPSDWVVLNEIDLESGQQRIVAEPGSFVVPPEIEPFLVEFADQHPLIMYNTATGDGSAKKISDFLTREEFHARPLYQKYYKVIGVEYQMAFTLTGTYPHVVALVFSSPHTDFTERDRAVLNVIRPHLVQAWFNAKEQGHLRSLLSSASDATAHSGAGLVILSDPPHELTPGALMTLYRFYGRPSKTGPVSSRVERWIAVQESRFNSPDRLELAKPLGAEIDGRRMVLRYLPGRLPDPPALLLREERRRFRSHQSYDALGLTTREAEIVGLVIKGETNVAIAQALHVSPNTVKKHLDNIYVKLGVRGRGRLTAFVLDIFER